MDKNQMYNHSAMLHDAFKSKANEVQDQQEKSMYEQLASDQKNISDRLKGDQNLEPNQEQDDASQ